MRIRANWIWVTACFLALPLSGENGARTASAQFRRGSQGPRYQAGSPLPTGSLYFAKPTIRWPIWAEGSSQITGGFMTLNGQEVRADYVPQQRSVVYVPPTPLPPGDYTVRCRVIWDGRVPADREWRFTVRPDALPELPAASPKAQAAIQLVNSIRGRLGLPAARIDLSLCAAAQAHSNYHVQNLGTPGAASPHEEVPGRTGYTGTHNWGRTRAFGFGGSGGGEDMAFQDSPERVIEGLFAAPYHRLPFLEAGSLLLGAGFSTVEFGEPGGKSPLKHAATFNFGRDAAEAGIAPIIITYPYPDQTEVPWEWHGGESPDPLAVHGAKVPVGYVISYAVFGGERPDQAKPRIRVARAEVTTTAGAAVPCYQSTAANDRNLGGSPNTLLLIPEQPLQPDTSYQVRIQATAPNGVDLSKEWTFRTAAKKQAPKPRAFNSPPAELPLPVSKRESPVTVGSLSEKGSDRAGMKGGGALLGRRGVAPR